MAESAYPAAMSSSSSSFLLIARRVAALKFARVCGIGEYRAVGVSNRGEFGKYSWFRIILVTPFSLGVSVRVVSVPTISVGSS